MTSREKALLNLAKAMGDMYFNEKRASFVCSFLGKLSEQEFVSACIEVGKDFKWMPQPVEFLKRSKLREDDEGEARLLVGKIFESIGRFGPYQIVEAKGYLGEIGWEIVRCFGGWLAVCEITHDQKPVLTAQWVSLYKSIKARKRMADMKVLSEKRHYKELS